MLQQWRLPPWKYILIYLIYTYLFGRWKDPSRILVDIGKEAAIIFVHEKNEISSLFCVCIMALSLSCSRCTHWVTLLEYCFRFCKYCIHSVRDIITFSQSNLYLCYVLKLLSEVNTGVPERINAQKKRVVKMKMITHTQNFKQLKYHTWSYQENSWARTTAHFTYLSWAPHKISTHIFKSKHLILGKYFCNLL